MSPLHRAMLLVAAVYLAAPVRCPAQGPAEVPEDLGEFRIGRLQYAGGGDWYANPSSLPNLLAQLRQRTGIPTADHEVSVTLDDERLYSYPLIYITGHGTIRPSPGDLQRLRRYLDAGGFLWADDNYGLNTSFRAMIAELYPEKTLVPLASDHPIYRSFYELPGLPKIHEHDGDPAQGFGIFDHGRLAVYYTWSSDIGDGLEDPEVHNDPPDVREAAMRMAINVCVYAMTQP
jgi:hypothetical protein